MAQFLGRTCFAVTGSAIIQTGVSLPLCFESSQRVIWFNEWSDSWGQSYKSCSPSQIFTNHELQIDQREDLSHNTHDSDDLERFEQCRQTHSCPSAYYGSTVQYMWPVQTGKELRLQFLRPVKQRCEIDMCLWQHARLWLVHSCSHLQLDRSIKHQRNFSVCQVWQMIQGLKPWKFQQMISVNSADQLDF